ncbi:pyruvate formate lyase family protein, partial [Oleisolibacter albus]|uniref:pyruvate formate lyase family protein n=1 Tax=Oleisolibacter albus TaxID=2171757 RepID=UPI0023D8EC67
MNMISRPLDTTDAWRGFSGSDWQDQVNVSAFIKANYTPYTGDSSFLAGPTARTTALWARLGALLKQERAKGVLDVSADRASSITAHDAGYIDRDNEIIVGLQTDAPL